MAEQNRPRAIDSGAELGLGCWFFGEYKRPEHDDGESLATIREALDLGIRHLDSAQGYGGGYSEALVGLAVKPRLEPDIVVTTKAHCKSTEEAIETVQESRARVNREVIDIFYIHWPRKGCDLKEMMRGLEAARERGWIKRIGVSNFSVEQMRDAMGGGTIDVHQTCYNLLWRYPERDVIPFCREQGISIVTYSSIAQGLLTDKTSRNPTFPENDARPNTVYYDEDVWPHVYDAVERMKGVGARNDRTLSDLAIRWVMAQEGIDVVLVGAKNRTQLERNVSALEGTIEQSTYEELSSISGDAMVHIPDIGNIFKNYP